jgi:hypothetical protein
MSEELNQEIEQPVAQDISDEQLDKFFEEGGKEPSPPANSNDEAQEEVKQPEPTPEETQAIEEEKHSRNYQAAMKEERARRQELQRLHELQAQKIAQMEERFQKIIEIKQQEELPKIPAYDEDPLENIRMTQKEIQDYVIQQNQYLQQQQAAAQRQSQQQQFIETYKAHTAEFAKSTPDCMQAYNYLVQTRLAEHQAAGYSEAQAHQLIVEDEAAIVAKAFSDGVNPAERIYSLAKLRGYAAKAPEKPNTSAMDETAKKLEQIQKSIQANKSLSNAGGKADTKQGLSLQSIAEMDDDEFDKVDWGKLVRAG